MQELEATQKPHSSKDCPREDGTTSRYIIRILGMGLVTIDPLRKGIYFLGGSTNLAAG